MLTSTAVVVILRHAQLRLEADNPGLAYGDTKRHPRDCLPPFHPRCLTGVLSFLQVLLLPSGTLSPGTLRS